MGLAIYIILKYAAYAGWCLLGLNLFESSIKNRTIAALAIGFLRLVMGLFFGVVIWILSTSAYAIYFKILGDGFGAGVFAYLMVYVPVRWFEWAIIDLILQRRRTTLASFLVGHDGVSRKWRVGGIAI